MRLIRRILLEVAHNPTPEDRLRHIFREWKLRLHKEFTTRAKEQMRRDGHIDEVLLHCIECNRNGLRDVGMSGVLYELEQGCPGLTPLHTEETLEHGSS